MRIAKLLLTGLLTATVPNAGACRNAATTARDAAAKVGASATKVGADAGTAYKPPVRTAHEIAVDDCLDKIERAKTPAQRRIYNETEAYMDEVGCEGEVRCKAIDYQDSSCIPFIPIYRLHELDSRFKPQRLKHQHNK